MEPGSLVRHSYENTIGIVLFVDTLTLANHYVEVWVPSRNDFVWWHKGACELLCV